MEFKICIKCQQNKPLCDFKRHRKKYKKSKNSNREYYYHPSCLGCNKEKKKAQDKAYKEKKKKDKAPRVLTINFEQQTCKDCCLNKPIEDFRLESYFIKDKVKKYYRVKICKNVIMQKSYHILENIKRKIGSN
jgi:hypothetical protein